MVKLYYFENQRYSKLKAQCERNESLFVDPVFPPETKSLYFSRATPPEPVEWKRPKVKSALKLSLILLTLFIRRLVFIESVMSAMSTIQDCNFKLQKLK